MIYKTKKNLKIEKKNGIPTFYVKTKTNKQQQQQQNKQKQKQTVKRELGIPILSTKNDQNLGEFQCLLLLLQPKKCLFFFEIPNEKCG